MTFKEKLKAGIDAIGNRYKSEHRIHNTQFRVRRMLERGLTIRDDNLTPKKYVERIIEFHRKQVNPASTDGSCATILLVGLERFMETDDSLPERLMGLEAGIRVEATRRYREPRPGGLADAVSAVRAAVCDERDVLEALREFIDPDKPDPGAVILLEFLTGYLEKE